MLEEIGSRIKVSLMIALFLAPVFVAAWNKQLDQWMGQNHRYYGSVGVSVQPNALKAVNAAR